MFFVYIYFVFKSTIFTTQLPLLSYFWFQFVLLNLVPWLNPQHVTHNSDGEIIEKDNVKTSTSQFIFLNNHFLVTTISKEVIGISKIVHNFDESPKSISVYGPRSGIQYLYPFKIKYPNFHTKFEAKICSSSPAGYQINFWNNESMLLPAAK